MNNKSIIFSLKAGKITLEEALELARRDERRTYGAWLLKRKVISLNDKVYETAETQAHIFELEENIPPLPPVGELPPIGVQRRLG